MPRVVSVRDPSVLGPSFRRLGPPLSWYGSLAYPRREQPLEARERNLWEKILTERFFVCLLVPYSYPRSFSAHARPHFFWVSCFHFIVAGIPCFQTPDAGILLPARSCAQLSLSSCVRVRTHSSLTVVPFFLALAAWRFVRRMRPDEPRSGKARTRASASRTRSKSSPECNASPRRSSSGKLERPPPPPLLPKPKPKSDQLQLKWPYPPATLKTPRRLGRIRFRGSSEMGLAL